MTPVVCICTSRYHFSLGELLAPSEPETHCDITTVLDERKQGVEWSDGLFGLARSRDLYM